MQHNSAFSKFSSQCCKKSNISVHLFFRSVTIYYGIQLLYFASGTVCCANDGWSTSKIEYSGTVHVLAWILDEENHDYDSYYQNISIHYATNPVPLPTILNIDDFFVTVEVRIMT